MPLSPSGKYTPLDQDYQVTENAVNSDTNNFYHGVPQTTGYVTSVGYQGIFPKPTGLFGSIDDANAACSLNSGLAGRNLGEAVRGIIPEDSARNLFQTLYDALVFATDEDRRRAVRMLLAAYDL